MHSNLVLPISWKLLLAQRNSMAALPTFGFTLDTLPFKMLRNSGQNPKWSNRIFRRRKYNNTSDYLVLSIKRYIFSLVHRWWQMTTDRNQTSHRHFRTLLVSVVITNDISWKPHLGIETKFDVQTYFCMNHRMLLWNAEPLNNADL